MEVVLDPGGSVVALGVIRKKSIGGRRKSSDSRQCVANKCGSKKGSLGLDVGIFLGRSKFDILFWNP